MDRLQSVSMKVNNTIRPIADAWTPSLQGVASQHECRQLRRAMLVAQKRQRLLAEGFPSSATLIAIVRLSDGEQHAILVVRTDQGDYVLDNLNDAVVPWSQVSYRWEKIQSPFETWTWHRL